MNLLNLLDELARSYDVNSKIDYDKLESFIHSVATEQEQTQSLSGKQGAGDHLFVIVKHYPDAPYEDHRTKLLRAASYSDAISRAGNAMISSTDDCVIKLYAACALDGWAGSDEGDIEVCDGIVTFVPDTSKAALRGFLSSNRPKRTLTLVRKQSGGFQVLYNGIPWITADSAEEALGYLGEQIDRFI